MKKYNRAILISIDTLSKEYQYLYEKYFNLIFSNYKTTNTWTLPSHIAMLTGFPAPKMYHAPKSSEISKYKNILYNIPSIATYLKAQGYATRAITSGGYMSKYFGWGHDWDKWEEIDDEKLYWKGEKIIPKKNEFIFIHTYYVHNWFNEEKELMKLVQNICNKELENESNLRLIKSAKRAYEKRAKKIAEKLTWINELPEDILVILTSDHAELFYEDGKNIQHGNFALSNPKIYDVPLLIKDHEKKQKIEKCYYDLNLINIIFSKLEIEYKTPKEIIRHGFTKANNKIITKNINDKIQKIIWMIKIKVTAKNIRWVCLNPKQVLKKYFYNILYKRKIKKYIPKPVFKIINPILKIFSNVFKKEKNKNICKIIPTDKKIVLFMDRFVPTYDKDAGSFITHQYLIVLVELGYDVIFWSYGDRKKENYSENLRQKGIKIFYGPSKFIDFIKYNGKHISYSILSRPLIANEFIDLVKKYTKSKILYNAIDLHFLREQRMADLKKQKDQNNPAIKQVELSIMKKSDLSLFFSNKETEIMKKTLPDIRTAVLPWIQPLSKKIINTREDKANKILFLGGFLHAPNVDAVIWFYNEIFPIIKSKIKNFKIIIAGSNIPDEIQKLNTERFEIAGFINENYLPQLFSETKIFVAPLRFGAGFKGKIAKAMSFGVPVVTTTIGAEGIGLCDGINACIADDAKKFAQKIIELYTNNLLHKKISKESKEHVNNNFSVANAKIKLQQLLKKV